MKSLCLAAVMAVAALAVSCERRKTPPPTPTLVGESGPVGGHMPDYRHPEDPVNATGIGGSGLLPANEELDRPAPPPGVSELERSEN